MAVLTAGEILKATGGEVISGDGGSFSGVSIDSRTTQKGEIFFALKGPRFDGHDFIGEAITNGAQGVVVNKNSKFQIPNSKFTIIIVEDTLKALQDLAHFLRMRKNIPAVAITGSNGKTTTKEMTYTILSRRFKVIKNEGNLNNHIGLPLSLTRLTPDDEVIVLELGMNAIGEIKRLCEIVVPSHGIITNIGPAHIGKLGDLDSIRRAKFEILYGLDTIILNADDSFLMQGYESIKMHKGFDGRLITFSIHSVRKEASCGISNRVNSDFHVLAKDVYATERGSNFILELSDGRSIPIALNIYGLFNVYNALAASAVSLSLGITVEEIKTALESYKAFPRRFEVMRKNDMTLIDDSYNANPVSMGEALKELVHLSGKGRAVAILGDMLELGEFSEKAHRDIMRMVSDIGIDVLIAVGEMMSSAAERGKGVKEKKSLPAIYLFRNTGEAIRDIMGILKHGDTVLVKGSHAMDMGKIVERIMGKNAI